MVIEILPMDLSSTVVIGSALSVIVVIISYVVYKIGIGEKSFEEVIEEQKRRSIEEEMKQKSEKVKKEKKFKKTWGKKSKEKVEIEVTPEPTQVTETKDVATDFEIIEPKEVKLAKQKNKPKSASNQQPVETSTQEKVKKTEASPVIDKPSQMKKKSSSEIEKAKPEPKIAETPRQVEEKEVSQSTVVTSVQSVPQPATTTHKKKKKEQVEKEAAPLTPNKLLLFIKESELEAEEIQNLIDVLLNKQKDSSGWTKKNDTLALTKKNLHEKEQLLDQELRQNQAVTSKLKDLREEYNAMKSKCSAQEKASQEKIARQQQDIQSLTDRVKQLLDQLSAEKEKLAQTDKESERKLQASVKSLEEEKAKLMQKITKLETESRSGISKTEFETVKKAREDLQKVHTLLVEQHTQLVLKEKNEFAQLTDAKSQIEKLSSQNKALSDDYKVLKDSKTAVEVAKRTVEDKLKVEEKRSADLEAQIKQLSQQAAEIAKLQAELQELRTENERLTQQLVTTKERVAGDGQEVVHQNGELNGKTQEIHEKTLDQKEKLLKEKESLLVQLNEDLNKQEAKIAVLNDEIENQKQKNNELREKNWKAMEALSNAEKNAEQRIKEIQTAADQKVAQLEKEASSKKITSSSSESSPEVTEKLKKAESEAAQRLSDYNIELEKNRQLSSEINKLKELHNERIAEAQKNVEKLKSEITESQLRSKECLQRLCPSVSIDSSLPFEKWVSEFEQQATVVLTSVSQSAKSSANFEELLEQKENEFLLKQQHYEQVLAETESTLSNLQRTAELQDVHWQERLKLKEKELEQITSERDALVTEKEAMQSTFQQISQLEELQEKLQLLQRTLENAECERTHVEQKYEEVHKNCLNLRDQLENKEKQILELQKESNRLDSLNKEIEDLKSKFENEKKINKDFSSQMVRLHSLVKIGQDALKAEQEMVKKLKGQLEGTQVSTANGTASATKANPVTVKESHPKIKSSEKSKKKMDASDKK